MQKHIHAAKSVRGPVRFLSEKSEVALVGCAAYFDK
jgi:hypothetical protein